MPYCAKCGSKVTEEMVFCPKCGSSLRAETTARVSRARDEKREKGEKNEKQEKGEKNEKSETSRSWALIGGMVLVILGVLSIAAIYVDLSEAWRNAIFLVILGVIIIVVALYGVVRASQRNPRP